MRTDELTKQQANAVLQALDSAIAEGPWEKSNFLRVIGKNLRGLREEFVSRINSAGQDSVIHATNLATMIALRKNQKKVFVALYSSDGKNMQSWEWIITNLPRQMIARAIYAEEDDVKAIIKTKENQVNEGYVAIYIDEDDILQVSPEKVPVDKLGKPRLLLKDGSFQLDNIDYFFHQSGTYHYSQARLIKDTSV